MKWGHVTYQFKGIFTSIQNGEANEKLVLLRELFKMALFNFQIMNPILKCPSDVT